MSVENGSEKLFFFYQPCQLFALNILFFDFQADRLKHSDFWNNGSKSKTLISENVHYCYLPKGNKVFLFF